MIFDMENLLTKILENRESCKYSIYYAEIYKKPTGFHSVEEMKKHIVEAIELDNQLCEEFRTRFPNDNLFYNLTKLQESIRYEKARKGNNNE